jgi:hypothetical protein
MRAPYRCPKCEARFYKFNFRMHSLKKPHDTSLAEFIGLRGSETLVRNWIIVSLTTLIILVLLVVLLPKLLMSS